MNQERKPGKPYGNQKRNLDGRLKTALAEHNDHVVPRQRPRNRKGVTNSFDTRVLASANLLLAGRIIDQFRINVPDKESHRHVQANGWQQRADRGRRWQIGKVVSCFCAIELGRSHFAAAIL